MSRYNEQQSVMEGSPMLISQQWPGIPSPVDAAVFYEGTYINIPLSTFLIISGISVLYWVENRVQKPRWFT